MNEKKEIKELYTLKEVNYLAEHYKKKVIGEIVDNSTKLKITSFQIEEYKKGFYDLRCFGIFLNQSSLLPHLSIKSVAKMLKLDLPKEVLKSIDL